MKTTIALTFALIFLWSYARAAEIPSMENYVDESQKSDEGVDAIIDDEDSEKTSSGFHGLFSNPFRKKKPSSHGDHHDNGNFLGGLSHLFSHKPEPPLIKTTTITIDVTKTVVRNPVCMTHYQHRPDCVHQVDVIQHHRPKSEGDVSEDEEVSSDGVETSHERSKRYLTFSDPTPAISEVKGTIEEGQIAEGGAVSGTGRYLFSKRETKYVTKTIRATKVKRVVNNSVTATLVVENCMPHGTNIPTCKKKPVIIKPSSHHWRAEEIKSDSKDMKDDNKPKEEVVKSEGAKSDS